MNVNLIINELYKKNPEEINSNFSYLFEINLKLLHTFEISFRKISFINEECILITMVDFTESIKNYK